MNRITARLRILIPHRNSLRIPLEAIGLLCIIDTYTPIVNNILIALINFKNQNIGLREFRGKLIRIFSTKVGPSCERTRNNILHSHL